jgi:hypothetical protein
MSNERGDGPERRRAPRVPVDIPVRIGFDGGERVDARMVNLSDLGLFVVTDHPCQVGDQAVVELRREDGAYVGLVEGRVRRRVVPPPGAPAPGGVGVEVVRVDKEWVRLCADLRQAG